MIKLQFLTMLFFFSIGFANAQNIDQEDIKYKYTRLPLKPLPADVKGYVSKVEQSYDAKNQELKAEYKEAMARADEKYKQDMIIYEKELKQADEDFKKANEEYNNKSVGKKTAEKVLLKDNKPVKRTVYKPERETVTLSTSGADYNKELLASTYLKLHGSTVNGANPVKITAVLNGFEIMDAEKVESSYTKVENGTSTSLKKYKYKIKYRHPVTLKVDVPGNGMVMQETVEATNAYTESFTPDANTEGDMMRYWDSNKEALTKKYDMEITNKSMELAGDLLNSTFGYSTIPRVAQLYTIKDKKGEYADITGAFTTAQLAFNSIDGGFKKEGVEEMKKSVSSWEKTLSESNPKDKKARVDEKVTIAVLFNLVEGYNVLEDYNSSIKTLIRLKGMDLSNKETRYQEKLSAFTQDQKLRFDAALK